MPMRSIFKTMLAPSLLLAISTVARADVYGTFINEKAPVKDLVAALAEPQDKAASVQHIQATVKKVCEKKGCWMMLEDQGKAVRVVFKNYGFFVGKKLEGKKVIAEGVMQKKVQSIAEQQHLLKDGGASKETIEAVKQPLEVYQFEATAVKTI